MIKHILQHLRKESFSGKIAFLNLNSRSRELCSVNPPFGLLSLMGICRDLSIPYGFIDADAYNMNDTEVITAINADKYEYIGVSLVSLMVSKIFPLLGRIKKETQATLIVGGPLPTADTQWLMENCRAIDYAVLGKGEVVLPQLLLVLERRSSLDHIPGIAYWDGDTLIIHDQDRVHCLPNESIPLPDFNAVDYRYYRGYAPVGAWPSTIITAIRGCPYKCTFCCNSVWAHKPHAISVPIVIYWLEELAKQGIKEVLFLDDTFNINHDWLAELCTGIIKKRLHEQMIFRATFRADLTNQEQLDLAHKAGFWQIFYGAESGNQRVLKYYRKGETLETIAHAVEMTHAAGLKSLTSFIVGAPIDTADTLLDTANFIRQIDPSYLMLHMLVPMIGAKVSEHLIERGLLTAQKIRYYDHTNPTIQTLALSTKELFEIYDFIRQDFLAFKKSTICRIKRHQELRSQNLDKSQITSQIEHEIKETESMEINGLPDHRVFDKSYNLSWMTDKICLFTEDIRLKAEEWYESERTLRWSRPIFELPFFLKREKKYMEVYWVSMRPKVEVNITFSTFDDEFSVLVTVTNPDWHNATIYLPEAISGPVLTKFEIREPFSAPNDHRELGMAFKTIKFL